ncbi:phage tail assembly chaperone [Dialister hominis]|uniref:Phage portal protein n=1 Tax=Dialister hominis TaxID=2582419 RepID=A0A8E4GYJ0_9FIRM|nr:hypothetical protein [Dialister hominis]BBK24448.1 hypothetical protein Dia5BBH33_03830 [Dialister hominis]BBK24934.1 hypothetical protein Dia5BBH33_08690 [Dialister hominis]
MNLTEALLKADVASVTEEATKDYEIPRLTKKFQTPFILHLQEIPPKRVAEIQSLAFEMDGKGKLSQGDLYAMNMLYVCEGVTNPEFADKEVLKHFKAATKKDLLAKLLNAGELSDASGEVQKLSGFDDGEDQEDKVKN